MDESIDSSRIEELLKGKTMKVYALLLTRKSFRLRDIQHTLRFSSPSLVLHHLAKLTEAELVQKDAYGDYSVKKNVRVGSLTLFVKVGRYFVPRFIFQATLLICILVPYLVLFASVPLDAKDFLFIFVCLISIAFFIYEAYSMWYLKPA